MNGTVWLIVLLCR